MVIYCTSTSFNFAVNNALYYVSGQLLSIRHQTMPGKSGLLPYFKCQVCGAVNMIEGVWRMTQGNPCRYSRPDPESSACNDFLDAGLNPA